MDALARLLRDAPSLTDGSVTALWARSGIDHLVGHDSESPRIPAAAIGITSLVSVCERVLGQRCSEYLGQRAAINQARHRGQTSCGGASRLLATRDGWVCLSLARADDVAMLPALLCPLLPIIEMDSLVFRECAALDEVFDAIAPLVGSVEASDLVSQAALLGMACSRVGEITTHSIGIDARQIALGVGPTAPRTLIDLSSMWAGPLCAKLVGDCCRVAVTKVESTSRPDGARIGPRQFWDSLHAGHSHVSIDFATAAGRTQLRELIAVADIVVEGSRPRALQQLGIDREELVADYPKLWLTIAGYPRSAGTDRAAFGDDAAAAGGLVTWLAGTPMFLGDALADPLTGIAGAAALVDCINLGGSWILDAAMSAICAHAHDIGQGHQ